MNPFKYGTDLPLRIKRGAGQAPSDSYAAYQTVVRGPEEGQPSNLILIYVRIMIYDCLLVIEKSE